MNTAPGKPGCLYIVATPIGNLADISQRAMDTLRKADLIAAEDTRHSAGLLRHLGIRRPMASLHGHNERKRAPVIIEKLVRGENVALISDAGTPLLSDPGYRLVDLVHETGIRVIPVPGPSAVTAALCASGIATDHFCFVGFLPSRTGQRLKTLKNLKDEPYTLVLFETPHRIRMALVDLCSVFGEQRMACYCRELTKQFETVVRKTLSGIRDLVDSDENQCRGEIVLVIEGSPDTGKHKGQPDYRMLLEGMMKNMTLTQAAALLARSCDRPRREFYRLGLEIKDENEHENET